MSTAEPIEHSTSKPNPRILLLLFGFGLLGEISAGSALPDALGADYRESPALFLAASVAGICAVASAAVLAVGLILKKQGLGLSAVGLGPANALRAAAVGVSWYLLFLPMVVASGVLVITILHLAGLPVPSSRIQEVVLYALKNKEALCLFLVMIAVAGPVLEEILFRGLLFTALRQKLSFGPAAVVSASTFALLHPMVYWLPVAILGFMLALVYEREKSLLPAIIAHSVHNGLIFLFTVYVLK
jgi:membrane protease YdiL (CAAX protease family)